MSSFQFPWWMQGIQWPVVKAPNYNTHVQSALSGKESRIAYKQYPQFDFTVGVSIARDDVVRQQILASTEDFSQSVWTPASTWVIGAPYSVGNTTPFGSLEGDFILEQPVSAGHGVSQSFPGAAGQYTLSMYVKPGGRTQVQLYVSGTTTAGTVTFDLVAGTVLSTSSAGNAVVTGQGLFPVGGGWYRVYMTFTWTAALAGTVYLFMYSGGTITYAGDGKSGVYVWGAQLENGALTGYMPNANNVAPQTYSDRWALYGLFNQLQGQFDTFYYEDPTFNSVVSELFGVGTGAQTVFQLQARDSANAANTGNSMAEQGGPAGYELIQATNGIPVIYRVGSDWQGTFQLLPVFRSNILLQSQTLGTSPWGAATALTATNAAGTAPDGTSTACTLIPTTANSQHAIAQNFAGTAGQLLILSIYAKPDGYNFIRLQINDGASTNYAYQLFNLNTGVLAATSLSNGTFYLVPYLTGITASANGFYRCYVGILCLSSAPAAVILSVSSTDSAANYAGNGTSGVYAWGAQLELVTQSSSNTAGMMPVAPTGYIATTTSTAGSTDINVTNGLVTVSSAPAVGVNLYWTGCFFYRCRFTTDSLDFSQFMKNWWEIKKISFLSVKI